MKELPFREVMSTGSQVRQGRHLMIKEMVKSLALVQRSLSHGELGFEKKVLRLAMDATNSKIKVGMMSEILVKT